MYNINVNFEVKDLIKRFLVNERKCIINIKNVESSYCINFTTSKNEINKTFNKFHYNNVNKYDV